MGLKIEGPSKNPIAYGCLESCGGGLLIFALIVAALVWSISSLASEGEGIERGPRNVSEELEDIAALMQSMATDLRNDQSNTRVQIDGKEIEERLAKLEKECEQEAIRQRNCKGKRGAGSVLRGKADGKETCGNGPVRRWNGVAIEAVRGSSGETEEIPAKWKSRIEAYFVSIAAADK